MTDPQAHKKQATQRESSDKKRGGINHAPQSQSLGAAMHQDKSEHHPIGAHGLDRHMHQSEHGYQHPLDNKFLGGFMKQR